MSIYDHIDETPGIVTALENLIDEAENTRRYINSLGQPAPASLGIAIEQARHALRELGDT